MTISATSTVDPINYIEMFLSTPNYTITGPVVGVWTVTVPDGLVTQEQLNAAIVSTVAYAASVANIATLKGQAAAQIIINNTFRALPTPTNAQVVAEVKALAAQNNVLMELAAKALTMP